MNESEIREKLERAVNTLFSKQPNIFEFTPETGQSEWNLAHHLAIEIHKMFPELDCDFDVVKVNLKNRRPDVIFHKRGTHESNYLVIEVKRDGHPADIRDDIKKIKSYWFEDQVHYRFGAVINLKGNKTYQIEVIQNNKAVRKSE